MPESVYTVSNVSKSTSTKIRRFYQPGRARQKQFLGGHRVLHNQQLRLSPEEFEKHAPSILDRVRRGIFHVTTPDGSQIYADNFGKLKIRKGQDIQDLPEQATPVAIPPSVPDVVEEEILAMEAEAPPAPVVVAPEPEPAPAPVVDEPDFTAAYTEKKPEPPFGGKKGKRR